MSDEPTGCDRTFPSDVKPSALCSDCGQMVGLHKRSDKMITGAEHDDADVELARKMSEGHWRVPMPFGRFGNVILHRYTR